MSIIGFTMHRAVYGPINSNARQISWIDGPTLLLLWVLFGVSLGLSVRYSRRFRREERRSFTRILEWQDVAASECVVYLRSFTDDATSSRRVTAGRLTEEEYLAGILSQVAPVVAIGVPGETQPQVGASRLYLEHHAWQESVEALLRRAKLVVIRTGLSQGLGWEIERTVRIVPPQRVLIVVDDKREMQVCLTSVRNVHARVATDVRLGWRTVCGIKGLLVFDEHWQVTALRLRGMGWYKHRQNNVVDPGLARSLYPLFRTLGVEWRRPKVGYGRVALFVLGVVAMLLGLAMRV
jgi:hypothetical protein